MISIVLPCYNEEAILPEALRRFTLAGQSFGKPYEILIINDGSRDNSQDIITDYSKSDPNVKLINFSRNFGHQAAISCGLRHASGNVVIVMDIDLQDPPEELHRFLAKWKEGYDVVYAVRQHRKENIFKRASYALFYKMLRRLANVDIPLDSGDFCVLDRKIVDLLNNMPERNRFVRGLRAWVGFKQIGIPYDRHARTAGETKYSLTKLFGLALSGLFSFSKFPLRFITVLGFSISIGSFAGLIFFTLHRLLDFKIFGYSPRDVPGTATIVTCLLFVGGIQLICLSFMGEYLGIIYEEVKNRPGWIIESRVGFQDGSSFSRTT